MSAQNNTNDPNNGSNGTTRTLISYFTPLRKRGGQDSQTTTPGTPTGGGRTPDGAVLQVQPLQAPTRLLQSAAPAQKRKAVRDDSESGEEDHDMQGKDVPTLFKRQRNKHDNPRTQDDASDEVTFAPSYPTFVMLDSVPGAFPSLALGSGPRTFSIDSLPIFRSGFIQDAGSSQDSGPNVTSSHVSTVTETGGGSGRVKKTTNPSRARRTPSRRSSTAPEGSDAGDESEPVVDEETGMSLALAALRKPKKGAARKRVRLSEPRQTSIQPSSARQSPSPLGLQDNMPPVPGASKEKAPATVQSDTTDSEHDRQPPEADVPGPSPEKGKGRADTGGGASGGIGGNGGGSRFVTWNELGDIQYSLRQLNNNVGRLVVLMGEQTQYFSTMQARGWQGPSTTAQPQSAPADATDGPDADVSVAANKLRRRAAHDPKPTELPTSRDPLRNALAARIRKATRELMGREDHKAPFYTDHLASDTEAEDYDPQQGPACGLDDFRPDLAGTPTNAWNACIVQLFVAHFMEKEPNADADEVTELFETHLKYLCNRYKESLQGAAGARRRQRLANRAERQRNLWVRRLTVAALHPQLQNHLPILQALGPHGMSSDESDHESGQGVHYRILRKPWRNPDVALWLRLFDKLYSILRLQNMTGSQPHPRTPSNIVSVRRPPVRGLPWNAYNQTWFKKLTDYDRTLLAPRMHETYNFTHPTSLRNEVGSA